MTFNLVALCGKSGSGKDYIADKYFVPYGYKKFSISTIGKTFLIGRGLATYEDLFVNKSSAIRSLMQTEFTKNGRDVYGQDVWIKSTLELLKILHLNWNINNFILPDVRFINEFNYIKKSGGNIYRIISNNDSILSTDQQKHSSEQELENISLCLFDGIIYNFRDARNIGDEMIPTLDEQMENILKLSK